MAMRRGRPGAYLMTDQYTGFTRYASELKKDYWGAYAKKPLKRNLQEIAHGLEDPAPVPRYSGPSYESFNSCLAEVAPLYVGLTNVPTNENNMAFQVLNLNPGLGSMSIGCTFRVH